MIAKITRGAQVGNIAGYLHGPGKANEHQYTDGVGRVQSGGVVIGSNIGAEGVTDAAEWAPELRAAHKTRPEITKPIWHASLRNTENDRVLSDGEWADAAQTFAESMGFAEHPWVAVRHGADHIHLVVSRVNEESAVWHGRNDRRQAQTACTQLEREHGLEAAPRQRVTAKTPARQVQAGQREKVAQIADKRAEKARAAQQQRAEVERIKRMRAVSFPTGSAGGPALTEQQRRAGGRDSSYQQRSRRLPPERDTGRER